MKKKYYAVLFDLGFTLYFEINNSPNAEKFVKKEAKAEYPEYTIYSIYEVSKEEYEQSLPIDKPESIAISLLNLQRNTKLGTNFINLISKIRYKNCQTPYIIFEGTTLSAYQRKFLKDNGFILTYTNKNRLYPYELYFFKNDVPKENKII